jgi:hypothetical protein
VRNPVVTTTPMTTRWRLPTEGGRDNGCHTCKIKFSTGLYLRFVDNFASCPQAVENLFHVK